MKKIFSFFILILVALTTIYLSNPVVNATTPSYSVTTVKAIDIKGNSIPDCEGVFSFTDGGLDSNLNLQDKIFYGYYPKVFFIPVDDKYAESSIFYYYVIDVESLPSSFYERDPVTNELIINPEDLYYVYITNGYWATYKYNIAVDKESRTIKSGVVGYLDSIVSKTSEETIYNFKVCFENSFNVSPYFIEVSSKSLSQEIIDTFNTNKMIGVFKQRWSILKDYSLKEGKFTSEVAVRLEYPESVDKFYPNSLYYTVFYANFDIPIDNISYIKMAVNIKIDRLWGIFHSYKNVEFVCEPVVKNEYHDSKFSVFSYVNDNIEKGSFKIDDTYYEFKITSPSSSGFISALPLNGTNFDSFEDVSILELTYTYLDYKYYYVGDPVSTEREQDSQYSPNISTPSFAELVKDLIEKIKKVNIKKTIYSIVFIAFAVLIIKYIVYPILLNKNKNPRYRK